MIHIQQRTDYDCGIAVAAMLARCSYEWAWRRSSLPPDANRGLWLDELQVLIERLTRWSWRITRVADRPLIDYRPQCSIGALWLQGPHEWQHCVVMGPLNCRPRMIYDPELTEPQLLPRYFRRNWLVKRLIWCPAVVSAQKQPH